MTLSKPYLCKYHDCDARVLYLHDCTWRSSQLWNTSCKRNDMCLQQRSINAHTHTHTHTFTWKTNAQTIRHTDTDTHTHTDTHRERERERERERDTHTQTQADRQTDRLLHLQVSETTPGACSKSAKIICNYAGCTADCSYNVRVCVREREKEREKVRER